MEQILNESWLTIKLEDGMFVAYLPNGEKLLGTLKITLSDNFEQGKKPMTATIECLVNIQ
jgi:hypothetical protein